MAGVRNTELKITVRESMNLDGNKYDHLTSKILYNVNEVSKRVVSIPTSSERIEILKVSSSIGAGSHLENEVRYIRLTNLDDTNFVTFTFKNTNNDEFAIKVEKESSFLYNGMSGSGVANSMEASGSALISGSFNSLNSIFAKADTSNCDIEYFVASTKQ
tara:strand:+ start:754 stop:1233 length:480 start_codon:yes stop_codon:yes gene_type:complete